MATNKKILRNLPSWLHNGQNINDLVDSLGAEFNLALQNIDSLKNDIQLSTSTGSRLDDIGAIFSLERDVGESDDIFRNRISSFYLSFRSSGTVAGLLQEINDVGIFASCDKTITQGYIPAVFDLTLNTTIEDVFITPQNINILRDILEASKSAGVLYNIIINLNLLEEQISITDNVVIELELFRKRYGNYTYGDIESIY